MVNSNCPQCGQVSKHVDNATIKSLLSVSLHRVADIPHSFCETTTCDIVYFASDHSEIFNQDDIRERVYQKEPDSEDVLVCYCFFHSVGDIQNSIGESELNPIIDDIQHGIQAGHCACDWRNPQGNCCLGNVMRLVNNS